MAKQRVNWLRSIGLVEKQEDQYLLTDEGRRFVENAVDVWADTEWTATPSDGDMTAGTYETITYARVVDPEFRATVLSRHDRTCPVSGVDHPSLLDVAHVLSWSDYPAYRADLRNVLPLGKTHHAAFDRGLFTIDQEYGIQVAPSFETQSELLKRTIIDQAGERVPLPDESLDPEYINRHNSSLGWV